MFPASSAGLPIPGHGAEAELSAWIGDPRMRASIRRCLRKVRAGLRRSARRPRRSEYRRLLCLFRRLPPVADRGLSDLLQLRRPVKIKEK